MEVSDYIKRAAQRTGYKREFFLEKNIPTHPSNVLAIPFYGDLRSTFILSSLLLRSYREVFKDKYIILCSWPGMRGLFPYVNEYWSIEDESVTKALASGANNFYNGDNLATELTRSLIEVVDVITATKELKDLYSNGFTKNYWDKFGKINRFLPEVPSASLITSDFKIQMERRPGQKIVVYPATKMRSKQQGETVLLPIQKDFWISLIERLIEDGFDPVVYQNWFTHDVSRDFADKCMYMVPRNVVDVLAAMRYVGCVLDVHTGVSRMALAARTPFLAVTERRSYFEDNDYEIDDLCGENLPKQCVYSFSTQLMTGGPSDWKVSVIDNIMVRLKEFLPMLKSLELPSTNESYVEVSYDKVRARKAKHMGVTFINSSKRK
jgi:hypothetical protein